MTKRFQTCKKCHEKPAVGFKAEEASLLEAIKSGNDQLARHILLEKQFSNLELQDRQRDGKYKP